MKSGHQCKSADEKLGEGMTYEECAAECTAGFAGATCQFSGAEACTDHGLVSSVVKDAAQVVELSAQCNSGHATACDTLSKEEDAKKAWLSKLDVPSWGGVCARAFIPISAPSPARALPP